MAKKYLVLDDETIDYISERSKIDKKSLQKKLDDSKKFGWAEVFWQSFGGWYSMRVDGELIYRGDLDRIMDTAREWTG